MTGYLFIGMTMVLATMFLFRFRQHLLTPALGALLLTACIPEVQPPQSIKLEGDLDRDGFDDCEFTDAASCDCDDYNSAVHPEAAEACNLRDDNCNGQTDEGVTMTYYFDGDDDGFGDDGTAEALCESVTGYVEQGGDCNDDDGEVHPDAEELCDGVDNNCTDGDEPAATTWYLDDDGDGWGSDEATVESCVAPSEEYLNVGGDCNDLDSAVNPGEAEVCDGVDNNCDAAIDDGAAAPSVWYADLDDDGYGDDPTAVEDCNQPTDFVAVGGDCDDLEATVNPGASEVCDGLDNDCDSVLPADETDGDTDGFSACEGDCDDGDSSRSPGEAEVCGDGVDNDCDGGANDATGDTYYTDADGDSYGDAAGATTTSCTHPGAGWATVTGDCDDADIDSFPGAEEFCDGDDNDCDGSTDEVGSTGESAWYEDGDGDTYGNAGITRDACSQPAGYVSDDTDCDDADSAVNPGETEVCNGTDDNCDGTADNNASDATSWYNDGDGDGYGTGAATLACSDPGAAWVADNTDCDDGDVGVYPGAAEACDGEDDDCDGTIDDGLALTSYYPDLDGDGYGDPSGEEEACAAPVGYITDGTDCDDGDSTVNPGETEVCDGLDNDCANGVDDGFTPTTYYLDTDSDGYGSGGGTVACSSPGASYVTQGGDCDETDAAVNPGATEACDGEDDDCDGSTDEAGATGESTWYADADTDGFGDALTSVDACDQPAGYVSDDTDCDDAAATAFPGGYEIDLIDSDSDGDFNAIDDQCTDGLDNDCDGTADESVDCGDGDGDGVENAIDMIVKFDTDGDGDDDLQCVVADADLTMPTPHDGFDAVIQGTSAVWGSGFATLVTTTVISYQGIDRDGDGTDEASGWCNPFNGVTLTGNTSWRFVSEIAEDGSTAAGTTCSTGASSTTWVAMDINDYCNTTRDPACRTYAGSDGCGYSIGKVIRTNYTLASDSITD